MLSILPRRGKRAYESFVAALIKTENKESSDFLRAKEDPLAAHKTLSNQSRKICQVTYRNLQSHMMKREIIPKNLRDHLKLLRIKVKNVDLQ